MRIVKLLRLIFINILVLFILLLILEFTLYNFSKKIAYNHNYYPKYFGGIKIFGYVKEKKLMRKPEGLQYKKAPIIVFGCSFAYGNNLNDNQTFSHKLSILSKRPVYNRAFNGWGMQQILYQLKRTDFYKEVKDPEYIIYVAIQDHFNRLFRYQFDPRCGCDYIFLRYKHTKNGFEEIHPQFPFLWQLYTVKYSQMFYEEKIIESDNNKRKNYDFLYEILHECMKYKNEHYPKAKFIILMYKNEEKSFLEDANLNKKLTNDGFTILDTSKLTYPIVFEEKKYRETDNLHPSEKAWDIIVPALIKKLKL